MVDRIAVLVLCSSLVTAMGCQSLKDWKANGYKLGPNYLRPIVKTADDWIDASRPDVGRHADGMDAWWRVFNDPVLEELVQAAYQQNLTLRDAGLRVMQARLSREISQRNLFPQSQRAFGQYSRVQSSRNAALFVPPLAFDDWDLGFDASWEADVWGRLRRQVEADDARLDAQVEAYDDILVMLIGDVAEGYMTLRSLDERLRLAERNVAIQGGSLDLARTRLKEGAESELDVQQAITNLKETEALIPSLRQSRRETINSLAVLLGVTPRELEASLRQRGVLPVIPDDVFVGIPAELLRRRPDVRAAERRVATESALIGVETAELYPQFTLTGEINLNAEDLSVLFSSASAAGFITPGFRWKILNYGRLRRNIDIQKLEFQRAIVQYEETVLAAHQEVEDGIVRFLESKARFVKLQESAVAAARSVDLVTAQYREGEVDFSQVFVLQGALVGAQDDLVSTQAEIAIGLIRTYRALGGGWQLRLSQPYYGAYPVEAITDAVLLPPIVLPDESIPADVPEAVEEISPESNVGIPQAPPRRDLRIDALEAEMEELLRQRENANENEAESQTGVDE